MGEEQGSQIRIFANGQEIASGIGEMKLTPSAEWPETEAPTEWNKPPSFEITGTITNDEQVAELINDIIRRSKFSRKEVKRMFVFIEAHIIYDGEVRSSAEMTYYTFPKDVAEKDFMFNGCEIEE